MDAQAAFENVRALQRDDPVREVLLDHRLFRARITAANVEDALPRLRPRHRPGLAVRREAREVGVDVLRARLGRGSNPAADECETLGERGTFGPERVMERIARV